MSSLAAESTISHYKIKELIGRGGMGEIYRAVDLQLGRVVALKTLSPTLTPDQDANLRFLREARAASILSHPSICTVFEVGRENDLVFIAMQYVQGKTIHELLARGPLPIFTALGYAINVAEALDEAHKNGVIHRDIKPTNIIVNERGSAIVLDFGLAKQVGVLGPLSEESPTMTPLTSAAMMIGTPQYMSPEQVRGEMVDARSDIFSFGATFYEMLTGERPFGGASRIDVLHSILHGEPKPVSRLRPEAGRELDRLVARALEKKREDRYQSASELIRDLRAVKGLAGGASSPSRIEGSWATAPTRSFQTNDFLSATSKLLSKRVPLRVPLIAGLIFLAAMAVWWFAFRTRSEPQTDLSSLRFIPLANWKSEPGSSDGHDAVFSRDGRLIAFSSKRNGYTNIWIKQITGGDQTTGGDPFQITRDEWDNVNPIWSADTNQVAFVSRRESRRNVGAVWRMPALGGTPTLVMDFENTTVNLKGWSRNGRLLYYESQPDLFAVDTDSRKISQVTDLDRLKLPIKYLSLSPGEDRVAYVQTKDGQSDLWIMPVSGGSPRQVTNDAAQDILPIWHPDGNRIIYSSKRDGTFQICVAFLDGRKPLQITQGEVDSTATDVSSDGTRILYSTSKEESDIWGVKVATGEEVEITSDVGVELWPAASPDNRTIAYQAIRDPSQGAKILNCSVMTKSIGGGQQIQLAADGFDPSWSPDGDRIAFLRISGRDRNIWIVRAGGGDEKQLTDTGVSISGYTTLPYSLFDKPYSWSPDGSRIAYCSVQSDESSVWIVSADGSNRARMLSRGGMSFSCPLWSPDGSRIVSLSTPSGKPSPVSVWSTDMATGKSEAIFQTDQRLQLIGCSASNRDVVVALQDVNSGSVLGEVSLIQLSSSGGTHEIARLKSAYRRNIQLSPDRRFIAFVSRLDGTDNVWIIPSSGGQPKALTANTDRWLYFSTMAFSNDGKTIYYGKQSRSNLLSMIENLK